MEFCLSSLVDLALGPPYNLSCENFDVLHTILHVILKKLNLMDVRVELSKESLEKVEVLVKKLPKEHSICFKEYNVKCDGSRTRKRKSHLIGPRKSLIHVHKKWQKDLVQDNETNVNMEYENFSSRITDMYDSINQKISVMENEIYKISSCYEEIQNFQKNLPSKSKGTKSHTDDQKNKLKTCGLKVNIRNQIEEINNHNDATSERHEHNEINWLKQNFLELSDSLKMHSNCLKRIKCEELPKIHSIQKEFSNVFLKNDSILKSIKHNESQQITNLKEMEKTIKKLQNQLLCLNEKTEHHEVNFENFRKNMNDEMCSLRHFQQEKKYENFLLGSNDSDLIISKIINIQNLHSGTTSDYQSEKSKEDLMENEEFDETEHKVLKHFFTNSTTFPIQIRGLINNTDNRSRESTSTCLNEIQKQVASQSICLQQLVRDLSLKIDRCEFEIYCRELNDIFDTVIQLKKDWQHSNAAGCTMSLMKNMNCMSCQANVAITTTTNFGNEKHEKVNVKNCHKTYEEGHAKSCRRSNNNQTKHKRVCTPYKCRTPLHKYRYRLNPYC